MEKRFKNNLEAFFLLMKPSVCVCIHVHICVHVYVWVHVYTYGPEIKIRGLSQSPSYLYFEAGSLSE